VRSGLRLPITVLLLISAVTVADAAAIDHLRNQEVVEVVAAQRGLGQPVAVRRAPARHAAPVAIEVPRLSVRSKLVQLRKDQAGALQVPADAQRAGWYVGSAHPGDAGPTVIVGHVDSYKGAGVFNELSALRHGDLILVPRADRTVARFVVQRVVSVAKRRFPTKAVYTGTTPGLRLVTCGGYFSKRTRHYRDNVIVFATPEPAPTKPANSRPAIPRRGTAS